MHLTNTSKDLNLTNSIPLFEEKYIQTITAGFPCRCCQEDGVSIVDVDACVSAQDQFYKYTTDGAYCTYDHGKVLVLAFSRGDGNPGREEMPMESSIVFVDVCFCPCVIVRQF